MAKAKEKQNAKRNDESRSTSASGVGVNLAGLMAVITGALACLIALRRRTNSGEAYPFERLVTWVEKAGGIVSSKVEYARSTDKGALLKARDAISQGELLLLIPDNVQITDASIRTNQLALARHVDGIADLSLNHKGVALMTTWLASQYGKYTGDAASTGDWRAFWDLFHPPSSMPFYQGKKELMYLFGSFEHRALDRYEFWYTRDHGLIVEDCKRSPGTCEQSVSDMDLGSFQAMSQFVLSHAIKGADGKPRIAPIFDLFNHAPEVDSSLHYHVDENGSVEVTAKHDILAGQELTISYGRRSNPELFGNWGFTDPPYAEPYWSVRIFTEKLAERAFPELDASDLDVDLRLATPWSRALGAGESDSADVTLQTLQEELRLGKGTVPSLLEAVEGIVGFFLAWHRQDRVIAEFVHVLQDNRARDPGSSVWWARYPEHPSAARHLQEDADLSHPRRIGFWNSTAVRVKMSEYLCVLAYEEALQHLRGELPVDRAMAVSLDLAASLLRRLPTAERATLPGAGAPSTDEGEDLG
mmetsp:Transcript_64472/g.185320  ORF Transcript_64472/g.185320 Transcript_64472/m.185320 type:complete len:530 (-) Transcript_64472:14-1603(-)|eukprot:CAMPEP_0177320256 /NCGR_PEP_ID=MMETSP0368-20130122/15041_1 /TAXON_ID=447022 ORGANISM="Scrippsiella hangoei-like, Strain SHHI-4" /NCGR_SAMPLE_ID=MMETSP0368 /ASSEMBLY_ACC=CAM_ASM_000363 /LENGTH=529 /DNA_ID=CAMNT_0018779801 /DNA_START=96 /DNA_END=1685 /DNA_ORIENTATION=+